MDFTITELYIACDDIDRDRTDRTTFYIYDKVGAYLWFNPREDFVYCGNYEDMPNELRNAGVDRFEFMPNGTVRILLYRRSV